MLKGVPFSIALFLALGKYAVFVAWIAMAQVDVSRG